MKKIAKILLICLMVVLFVGMRHMNVYALEPASEPVYEGIDVSTYQGNINYTKVKEAGIKIVYIKASEGTYLVDPQFRNNYQKAKENGLKVGFYHYVVARTQEEAIQEAEFFYAVIKGTTPDCRLAMDFESFGELTNEQINEISLAFLQKLQELTNKEVVIYSNAYSARTKFSVELAQLYPLWIAEYGVEVPTSNVNWNNWIGFQFTDKGEVSGINGYVDRDKFTKEIFLSTAGEVIPEPENPQPPENNEVIYIVKRGDTLSQIAKDYGVSVQSIVDNNGIVNPNLIYVGQKLIIKGGTENAGGEQNQVVYIVKRGDSLSQIAQNYRVSVQSIVNSNNIANPNLIYVGQRLVIKGTQGFQPNYIYYRVRWGDNLYRIARRYRVSVQSIVRLNHIMNPNLIYAGQLLKIGR